MHTCGSANGELIAASDPHCSPSMLYLVLVFCFRYDLSSSAINPASIVSSIPNMEQWKPAVKGGFRAFIIDGDQQSRICADRECSFRQVASRVLAHLRRSSVIITDSWVILGFDPFRYDRPYDNLLNSKAPKKVRFWCESMTRSHRHSSVFLYF